MQKLNVNEAVCSILQHMHQHSAFQCKIFMIFFSEQCNVLCDVFLIRL